MPQLRDRNYYSTTFQRAEKLLFLVILHFTKTAGGWYKRDGFCLHATCENFEFFFTLFLHTLRDPQFFYKNLPEILPLFPYPFQKLTKLLPNNGTSSQCHL